MEFLKDPEYRQALRYDTGLNLFCAKCHDVNDNWDDCGFWYFGHHLGLGDTATCKKCSPWHLHKGDR